MAVIKLNISKTSSPQKNLIPDKYYKAIRKSFNMVLRPHNVLLRKLQSYQGLCNVHSPMSLKASKKKTKKLVKNSEKVCKKASIETPYQFYRKKLVQTPLTPDNPFNATPASLLRRSTHIFRLGSASQSTPFGNAAVKSSARKKRKIKDDKRDSELSPFSSGIRALVLNSDELTKVIKRDEDEEATSKRLRVVNTDTATKSTGWSYSPMYDSARKNPDKFKTHDQLRRKSCRRRLSARLRKMSKNVSQNLETENMYGLPQLRGKYNHALYFDG